MRCNLIQILIAIATAAACSYWQHSAGILAWMGCITVAHVGHQFKPQR